MSVVARPATIGDLNQLVMAKKSPLTAGNYRAIAREVVAGSVFAVWSGERCIGLGAVSVIETGGPGVAWCSVVDGGVGVENGVGVVRAIRSVIVSEACRANEIIALVDEANDRGKRLARLAGFAPTDAVKFGMRVWKWATYSRAGQLAGRPL